MKSIDWRRALALALLAGLASSGAAQVPLSKVFDGAPAASWIFPPDAPPDAYGVYHFRRTLELPTRPERFVVHVSGDNRYRLFVNGRLVSSGPQRSDLMHWRYETVDLAPSLRAGRNVVAALVWNWGAERPVAQFSHRTGFLLQGNSERESAANTGPEWKVLRNPGYEPVPVRGPARGGYYAAPPGESVDGSVYPWGWQELDFADASWPKAAAGEGWGAPRTQPRGSAPTGEGGGWQLVPRSIPPMEETDVRFAVVRRAEGMGTGDAFLRGAGDLVIPAHTKAQALLDQSHLTNAYAVLETSGGAGSRVHLTYAEGLKDAQGNKGNRNEIEGKTAIGVEDVIRPGGGVHRRFQSLWFRTYRYVQLDVETGDEPLVIHDLHGIFTAFPFEEKARFSSDLPWLADMWKMNWRVARLCAFETYFDTPYYEQLQYVGDTRIQALVSLYMAGDDRLVRQAITHFDQSRIPDGITASRYPSSLGQYIPTFSLLWVAMVHDYWMHRDDAAYVRALIPGIRGVLAWYERQLDENAGLLGRMPWWSFVDWAREWRLGVPPGVQDGHSVMVTLQFVYALERAADLEDALGLPAEGARDRALAVKLKAAARAGPGTPAAASSKTHRKDRPSASRRTRWPCSWTRCRPPTSVRSWRRSCPMHRSSSRRTTTASTSSRRSGRPGSPTATWNGSGRGRRCWRWGSPRRPRPRSPHARILMPGRLIRTTGSWPRCSACDRTRRASARCGSRRISVRCSAPKVASLTRSATSRCGSSARERAVFREKSRFPRA